MSEPWRTIAGLIVTGMLAAIPLLMLLCAQTEARIQEHRERNQWRK